VSGLWRDHPHVRLRPRDSHRNRILDLLKTRSPAWVPAFEVAALALQYNTRLKELREAGHSIENKTERCNGITRSWFRLTPQSREPAPAPPAPRKVAPAPSLFGDLPPQWRYPD
jgi:hypothetical protein